MLVSICLLAAAHALPRVTLSEKRIPRQFVDENGREVFFHGVNVVVKGPPYLPRTDSFDTNTSLSDYDFELLQRSGVNVIRLGAMWPGVEPQRGVYNQTYLKALGDIVERAARYGIYTLLDMHQDDLSEKFCGEGVPDWAALPLHSPAFPWPVGPAFNKTDPQGYPLRSLCNQHNWPAYYTSEAVSVAFQALYNNTNGIRDAWGQFWAKLAVTFKGNPNVLGLELINEPWAGNVFAHPELFIPGVADREVLQPAYDALAKAVRAVDDNVLLFFAGVTWDDVGVGFQHVPGGEQYANRSVLAYHYYEPPQFGSKFDIAIRVRDADRLKCGLMLTEFGAPGYNGNFSYEADLMDQHLQSWILWEYKDFCFDDAASLARDWQYGAYGACKTGYGGGMFNPQGPVAERWEQVARPFARAVGGETIKQTHAEQPRSATLDLIWTQTTSSSGGTTDVYVPDRWLSSSLEVSVDPKGSVDCTVVASTRSVLCKPVGTQASGKTLHLTITAQF